MAIHLAVETDTPGMWYPLPLPEDVEEVDDDEDDGEEEADAECEAGAHELCPPEILTDSPG
jgi:hypothetical protein